MKELMMLTDIDLCSGGKEQYHSAASFAFFDCTGGKLTKQIVDAICNVKLKSEYHKLLSEKVHTKWGFLDGKET